MDGESEELPEPTVNPLQIIEAELRGCSVLPEPHLREVRVECAPQLVNARRPLPVYDRPVLIEDRVKAVVLEEPARGDPRLAQFESIERLNRENQNPSKTHKLRTIKGMRPAAMRPLGNA